MTIRGAAALPATVVLLLALALAAPLRSEEGILVLHVEDTKERPIAGVQLAPQGDGAAGPPTDKTGRTRLRLAPATRSGHWVSLQILPRKGGPDWVFISPWNQRVLVPSFANESENFVPLVLAESGSRDLLVSGQALEAVTARILEQLGPKIDKGEVTDEERKRVLTEQAAAFGLKPKEVDEAIRAWGEKTKDPYQAGLVALYAKNYSKAVERLEDSLELRRQKLAEARAEVAAAAFFLGQSHLAQGRYREAASAYREALDVGGEDEVVLFNLGVALWEAGDLQDARPAFQRSLELAENNWGAEHPNVADSLEGLAAIFDDQGRYAEAEPLYQRALKIREKTLGPEHPDVATSLNNLAINYEDQGRYPEAEPLHLRALRIQEKALGPENPDVALSLNNLAGLYEDQERYAEAEPLYRRSLKIYEKALGPKHPDVAMSLNNLASLYDSQGRYAEAEPLYRRALKIWEEALGPEHLDVARGLHNLAALYSAQDKFEPAEDLSRRALAIADKSLGVCHPTTEVMLRSYAAVLQALGRAEEAQSLFDRASQIQLGECKEE